MRTTLLISLALLCASACGTSSKNRRVGAVLVPPRLTISLDPEATFPLQVGTIRLDALEAVKVSQSLVEVGGEFELPFYLERPGEERPTDDPVEDDPDVLPYSFQTTLSRGESTQLRVIVTAYFEGPEETVMNVVGTSPNSGEVFSQIRFVLENVPAESPAPEEPDYELEAQEILLSLMKAEGITIFPRPFAEEVASPGDAVAAVACEAGAAIVNLKEGTEIDTVAFNGTCYEARLLYDPTGPHAALCVVGTDGLQCAPYDFGSGTWGAPQAFMTGENCTDLVYAQREPLGTTELLFTNQDGNYYGRFSRASGTYGVVSGSIVSGATFPGATSPLVSACPTSDANTVLAVTLDDSTWQIRSGTPSLASIAGSQPRRIRACGPFAVVTDFGEGGTSFGSVKFLERDASGDWTIFSGLTWSSGPLGLDCLARSDGTYAFLLTNFFTNELRLDVLDAGGNFLQDDILPAAAGCTGTGHCRWIQENAAAYTCNTQSSLVVMILGK